MKKREVTCPACGSEDLEVMGTGFTCKSCNCSFPNPNKKEREYPYKTHLPENAERGKTREAMVTSYQIAIGKNLGEDLNGLTYNEANQKIWSLRKEKYEALGIKKGATVTGYNRIGTVVNIFPRYDTASINWREPISERKKSGKPIYTSTVAISALHIATLE